MTTEAFPKIRRADLTDAQAFADIRNEQGPRPDERQCEVK
jgi:hypothetical protein